MKTQIFNLSVEQRSEYSDVSIGWNDADNNRYHVWLNRDTLQRREDTIYKNPPIEVTFKGPGYFPTRRLSLAIAKNKYTFDVAMQQAAGQDLFSKAQRTLQTQIDAENEERKQIVARNLKRDNAEALYSALKNLLEFGTFDLSLDSTRQLIAEASAALAAAERGAK